VYFWLVCFLSGLAVSRLFYFLFFYGAGFWRSFILFFDITKSGLTSFGGLFGAVLSGFIYYLIKKKNIKVWRLLDIVSIGIMLGLAIGRVGCFFAGCCYGKKIIWNIPWAVEYKDALRHPVQLYDLLNALFVFGVIQKIKYKKMFDGALFLLNMIIYSFIRIIIELFRVNSKIWGITYNQILYFLLLVVCICIFIYKLNKK